MRTITPWVLCLGLLGGCRAPASSRPFTADVFLDHQHRSVVHLSSDCSGTLVTPNRVLTAGHCVAGVRSLHAYVAGESLEVQRCDIHPEAGRSCLSASHAVAAKHDIAVLRLVREAPLAPLPVALRPPPELDEVWLVGFFRQPLMVGAARRYGGLNRVVRRRGRLLHTEPAERYGFSTRLGSSGGPALHRVGRREVVVGVLHGGERALSPDSIYVTTYHPGNARWLRRALR